MTSKTHSELGKEVADLRAQIELLKREKAARAQTKPNARVYADDFMSEIDKNTKAQMIWRLKDKIKALLMFASENDRMIKSHQFEAQFAVFKDALEEWTIEKTGNRWLIKMFLINAADPAKKGPKDFIDITLVHKGFIRPKLIGSNATLTPEPVDIMMHTRVHRYEVEEL
jgi:hypothetical protein